MKIQPTDIILKETTIDDLPAFFQFQLHVEANYMAAFTAKDPADKPAFIEKYTRFLNDPTITMRTIRIKDVITGSIASFLMEGDAEITYWIDSNYWGKGIATTALRHFLEVHTARPLYGRVAFDNLASQKVLEKCGFIKSGTGKGFANARQQEIEEYVYKLQ